MRTKPRKPTALRVLEGNPGHRPLPQNEPKPAAAIPDPPPHLHAYAVEKWNELAPRLAALDLLTDLDGAILGAFCDSYARWRIASEMIAAKAAADPESGGLLITMPSGAVVQDPLVGIANKAMRDMCRYGAELGLSASARASFERAAAVDQDKMARKYGIV